MSLSTDIKTQIQALLEELVPGTLGQVLVDSFQPDIDKYDIGKFPAAILATPSVPVSTRETNRENERIYQYEVFIIMNGNDVDNATAAETLMDALLDKFDGNSTLSGAAISVNPATIPQAPVPTPDRSRIFFSMFLNVRALADADC